MPRIHQPNRNQEPTDQGGERQQSFAPAPKPKRNGGGGGWSKVKWVLGGIAVGVLGAIGYDLYQKGKKSLSSNPGDDRPQLNPTPGPFGAGMAGGFGPATHTTVVGMPMPTIYPMAAPAPPQLGNPAHWNPARNDYDDDADLYDKAQKIAEKNAKRRREKLEELVRQFEEED